MVHWDLQWNIHWEIHRDIKRWLPTHVLLDVSYIWRIFWWHSCIRSVVYRVWRNSLGFCLEVSLPPSLAIKRLSSMAWKSAIGLKPFVTGCRTVKSFGCSQSQMSHHMKIAPVGWVCYRGIYHCQLTRWCHINTLQVVGLLGHSIGAHIMLMSHLANSPVQN